MKRIVLLLTVLLSTFIAQSQSILPLKAEIVRIFSSKPPGAELRIENSTKTIPGFLKGNGIDGTTHFQFIDLPQEGIVLGGIVTWDSGLTFSISAAIYYINGVRYTSNDTTLTLTAADPSDPRTDAFILTTAGIGTYLTGIPASDPLTPQADPSSELFLTSVDVAAGATLPGNISTTMIYNENIEWTHAINGISPDFDNTTNPYNLLKAVNVGSWTNGDIFTFISPAAFQIQSYGVLTFAIRLKAVVSNSANITLKWRSGSNNVVSTTVTLTAANNFSKSIINQYQVVSIPISSFGFTNTNVDGLRFTLTGIGSGFYLDWVQLQAGTTTITPNNYVTQVYRKTATDSVFYVVNGVSVYAYKDSSGGGSITADNGLTMSTPTNPQLGGTLLQNTTISTSFWNLNVTGANSVDQVMLVSNSGFGVGIYGKNTSGDGSSMGVRAESSTVGLNGTGIGLYASSEVGRAVYAHSLSGTTGYFASETGVPLNTEIVFSTNANGVLPSIQLRRKNSTGNPSIGVGQSIEYYTFSGSQYRLSNQLISSLTTVASTPTSEFSITGVNSGVTGTLFTLSGNGALKLNKYGVGSFTTGTTAYTLKVNSSGDVFEGTTTNITTATDTTALKALSHANWDYVILRNTNDYYNGYNGIYHYNASSGQFTATGGGFWYKEVPALQDDNSGAADTHYEMQKQLVIFNNRTASYGHSFSATKPVMMLTLRNDNGDITNNAWGGMISGDAFGGAINFVSDFSNAANRMLQLGVIDNNYTFTNMLEMHYATAGNTAILRVPLVPSASLGQTIGSSALPFGSGWFGGLTLGIAAKTSAYTTTATDYTVSADATTGAFSVTLGSSLGTGKVQTVIKTDSGGNVVTVAGTINGVSNYSLTTQWQFVTVQYNGTNWYVIGKN